MCKFNDINSFRDYFIEGVSKTLNNVGYKYIKSKESFVAISGNDVFQIAVYMYKRPTFIEIETKAYYGNKKIESDLKKSGIKVLNDLISGGSVKFICEYYFKQKYPEKYSNLIYELDEDANDIIQTWLCYYEKFIKQFLKDMSNPEILNKVVNKEDIDKAGLSSSYEARALKFYYVGKNAGLNEDELKKLSELYEKELKSVNARYLPKFLELKKIIFDNGNDLNVLFSKNTNIKY